MNTPRPFYQLRIRTVVLLLSVCGIAARSCFATQPPQDTVTLTSPDGRNEIRLLTTADGKRTVGYQISRDGHRLIGPSPFGLTLTQQATLGVGDTITDVNHSNGVEEFELRFHRNRQVREPYSQTLISLKSAQGETWQLEFRAFNDGVAFRYRMPAQQDAQPAVIESDLAEFGIHDDPIATFNRLNGFQSSHESPYIRQPLSQLQQAALLDMPILLQWKSGVAAAITEARVRNFAGGYLKRSANTSSDRSTSTTLQLQLSPSLEEGQPTVRVATPAASPWRVILLADSPGRFLETDLLACLNDPAATSFEWLEPGKTTWHWWAGEFEQDYQNSNGAADFFQRHCRYIDFCAENGITYHAISGDGRAWYQQSATGYGRPMPDADVCVARPELQLPRIIRYAKERGVRIRLWVHWQPLSRKLEEAFAVYESWGVAGLMVDFLNRDDQQMIEFVDRLLNVAADHHLHIQLHGASKFSGEQRTFPHLFNREGVLNLEVLKWGTECDPQHNVNVALTRGITGPVDYHLGGFRSVSKTDFRPSNLLPNVLGTRCHHLALYVVYENPMPMISDAPQAYIDQPGFQFLKAVPTVWDETQCLKADVGKSVVVARRKGQDWYVAGITNWTARSIQLPLSFAAPGKYRLQLFEDGSLSEDRPNAVRMTERFVAGDSSVKVTMAPGGGFCFIMSPTQTNEP